MKTLGRERDKAEIVARLRTVRPDSPRRWGLMTAHQMICHLSDAFRMSIGQKSVSHVATPLRRTMVKWIALYVPVPWPSGILTRPEIDQASGGTPPVDFAADVRELETLLDVVTAQSKRFEWQSHPIFGTMSEAAWLRWGYLHMDHHLRQFSA